MVRATEPSARPKRSFFSRLQPLKLSLVAAPPRCVYSWNVLSWNLNSASLSCVSPGKILTLPPRAAEPERPIFIESEAAAR